MGSETKWYDERTDREMLIEVSRDVKWICRALSRLERRVHDLEVGKTMARREQGLTISAGGAVGGLVAVLMRLLSGG
ncbi:MAG: hypothetical protein ACXQTG_04335 [Methanoculleaceae archaeon]